MLQRYSDHKVTWLRGDCQRRSIDTRETSDTHGTSDRRLLLLIVVVAVILHVAGIRRDLPYAPEADEPIKVTAAVTMAATGDLNPRWFGHPGATVIYPLALAYHMWHAIAHNGRLVAPDPNLVNSYGTLAPELVLLGRLLTIAYSVLCVPLVYLVGRLAFGRRQALIGAAFAAVLPVAVWYAQIVRTDSAATFFALLSLWRCLVALERPSGRNQAFAGGAIGLAIASRYFMVTLVPVLIAVDALLLLRSRRSGDGLRTPLIAISFGAVAIPLAFAVASPYVILDYETVLSDLRYESRSVQLGADTLSPLGNLVWYPTRALPEAMTLPLAALAVVGIVHALRRRNTKALVLLVFPVVLICAISMSALHWTRWIIQTLPVLALFAADGLLAITDTVADHTGRGGRARTWLAIGAAMVVAAPAVHQVVMNDLRQSRESTRLQARKWLLEELPAGSKVALEWWTAPMFAEDFHGFVRERSGTADGTPPGTPRGTADGAPGGTAGGAENGTAGHTARGTAGGPPDGESSFEIQQHWQLPAAGSVDDFRREGFDYLVVSGNWFGPIMADEDGNPREAAFYRELFESGPPIAEFAGSRTRGGPLIRVFELRKP
jgi:4-amino-4-deoxy-L-arabinose transferase-like glycosyltransferase